MVEGIVKVGGKVERVKANMEALALSKERVDWERYRKAIEPLEPLLEEMAEQLGVEKGWLLGPSLLPLGLPLRLPLASWQGLVPREVRELIPLLEEIGNLDYIMEWRLSQGENLAIVAEAARRAGLGDANRELNDKLGKLTAEWIGRKGEKEVRVLDVGAGTGDTAAALLYHLGKRGKVKGLMLLATDLSVDALGDVKEKAIEMAKGKEKEEVRAFLRDVEVRKGLFNFNVDERPGGYAGIFDVIIANASLHHTNNVGRVARKLAAMLPEGGLLAIGEWTHALHSSVEAVRAALEVLGRALKGEEVKLESFGEAERRILSFWIEVVKLARERRERSPIWYLEGHLPAEKWEEKLRGAFEMLSKECFNGGLNTVWVWRARREQSVTAYAFSNAWMGEHP